MTIRVRVSIRAADDVNTIFDWISLKSTDGAFRWLNAYLELLRLLPARAAAMRTCPRV
jgi:hypothetical protein